VHHRGYQLIHGVTATCAATRQPIDQHHQRLGKIKQREQGFGWFFNERFR
jgi:hypothetical protein